ncbi:MAG: SDR family oxidoreductase [Flavobacteriales bacterium]|nr:SDR family oxidoreductase [Flavobacteriales bacterium]
MKTVWITGASSGIGEALAHYYSKKGFNLILSARNESALEVVAKSCQTNGEIYIIPLDLADSKTIENAVEMAKKNVSKIDILINNGGISQRSKITDTPETVDRRIFEINYFGTVALTKKVLPWMIETGGGNISVVSSISGKFGFPLRSSYSASKHAVVGYFETLGLEYINQNIRTTVVCPGRIRTNISKNALNPDGKPTGQMDDGQRNGMSVEVCAAKIGKAIARNKREVLIGKKELILYYIHKYLPTLFWKIAPKINPK